MFRMKHAVVFFFAFGIGVAHGGVITGSVAGKLRGSVAPNVEITGAKHSTAFSEESLIQASDSEIPTPVVKHVKHRGHGYQTGSPLFKKQEAMKEFTVPAASVPEFETVAAESGWQPFSDWFPIPLPGQPAVLNTKQTLWGSLAYIILIFLVAYMYRQSRYDALKPDKITDPFQGDDFTFGFCEIQGCYRDWKLCCLAWWCPSIRWASTVSHDKVRMLKFWAALAIFLILTVLLQATAGISACGLACVGIYFRQRLRGYFGHGRATFRTLALDTLAWCCCPFCAIVQEAREVEHVERKRNGA